MSALIAPSDLLHVSEWVASIAVITTSIGLVALRMLAGRSIAAMLTVVAAVTVVTSLAGVGAIAVLMLAPGSDQKVMLELLGIAGLAGFAVALFVSRKLSKASRLLLGAVQEVGETGFYEPPRVTLPAELAGLSEGLSAAHERLAHGRERERALRRAGGNWSPGSAMTCAPRWPGCARWLRPWRTGSSGTTRR
jgi:hypothetical protein